MGFYFGWYSVVAKDLLARRVQSDGRLTSFLVHSIIILYFQVITI